MIVRDVPPTRRMRGTPMKTTDSDGRQPSLPRAKLRVNEAARHLDLAVSTMNKMRLSGSGPVSSGSPKGGWLTIWMTLRRGRLSGNDRARRSNCSAPASSRESQTGRPI